MVFVPALNVFTSPALEYEDIVILSTSIESVRVVVDPPPELSPICMLPRSLPFASTSASVSNIIIAVFEPPVALLKVPENVADPFIAIVVSAPWLKVPPAWLNIPTVNVLLPLLKLPPDW